MLLVEDDEMFYSREAIADMLYEDTQFNIQLYDKLYKIMHGKQRKLKCPSDQVIELLVGSGSAKGSYRYRYENIRDRDGLCRSLMDSDMIFALKPLINSNYEPVVVEKMFSEKKITEGYCIRGNHEDEKALIFEIKHYDFIESEGRVVNDTPHQGPIELRFMFKNKEDMVEARYEND